MNNYGCSIDPERERANIFLSLTFTVEAALTLHTKSKQQDLRFFIRHSVFFLVKGIKSNRSKVKRNANGVVLK